MCTCVCEDHKPRFDGIVGWKREKGSGPYRDGVLTMQMTQHSLQLDVTNPCQLFLQLGGNYPMCFGLGRHRPPCKTLGSFQLS